MGLICNVSITNGGVAQTIGFVGSGRTYPINNAQPVIFGCVHVVLVTSAAVGNRNLVCRLLDGASNILFEMAAPNVGPSLTARISYGAGMTAATGGPATAPYIAVAAPDMQLPPLAQLNIFDAQSVDTNDTILASVATGYIS